MRKQVQANKARRSFRERHELFVASRNKQNVRFVGRGWLEERGDFRKAVA
jgi:hypothetical protein